jgi:tetratricopeptide (TPR) repeat protein
MPQETSNPLEPFLDINNTLSGLRQRFAGAYYNLAHCAQSGLRYLEEADEAVCWECSVEAPEDERYYRVDFLLAFDGAGCFLDIEGNGYRRDGFPYREMIEEGGGWLANPAAVLSKGIVRPAPADAQSDWRVMAGDYPARDALLDAPLEVQQTDVVCGRIAESLNRDYRWAMRCLTGVARHADYSPVTGDLIWLAYLAVNRGRKREAAGLLALCLARSPFDPYVLCRAADIFLPLALPLEALKAVLEAIRLDEYSEEVWTQLWKVVDQTVPVLVRQRRWTDLDEVVPALIQLGEDASQQHRGLVLTAHGLSLLHRGHTAESTTFLQRAIVEDSSSSTARTALNLCEEGDEDILRSTLTALLEQFPENPGSAEADVASGARVHPAASHGPQSTIFLPAYEARKPLHTTAGLCLQRWLEACPNVLHAEVLWGGLSFEPDQTFVTRDGQRGFVYVRVHDSAEVSPPASAQETDAQKVSCAAARGMTPCFFVDVVLNEVLGGYEARFQGLEALEALVSGATTTCASEHT